MRRGCFVAAVMAGSLAGLPCAAQTAPARDVQLLAPGGGWTDGALLATSLTAALVGNFALQPPSDVPAPFDGHGHRAPDDGIDLASTVLLATGLAAGAAGAWATDRFALHRGGWEQLRGVLVLGESVALTLGLVSMLKNLGECRPRAWDDASQRCVGTVPGMPVREDRVSFPSGHTSPLAALAGASLGLAVLPAGGRRAWAPMAGVAGALALTMMVLRVAAGAHDWVDTGTGLGIGLAAGFGTAALHTRALPVQLTAGANGLALRGTF